MTTSTLTKGSIVQVLGAVVDIEFPPDKLPEIYNAVLTRPAGAEQDLTLEVEQLLGKGCGPGCRLLARPVSGSDRSSGRSIGPWIGTHK